MWNRGVNGGMWLSLCEKEEWGGEQDAEDHAKLVVRHPSGRCSEVLYGCFSGFEDWSVTDTGA